jgi:adenylate cyclase
MWWFRQLLKKLTGSELKSFVRSHRYSLGMSGAFTLIGLFFFICVDVSHLGGALFQLIDQYEARAMDARFAFRGVRKPDPRIVIVAMDQATINRLGYPFARSWHALMLQRVCGDGARSVGLDIAFPFPDRSSPLNMLGQLEQQMKASGQTPDTALFGRMNEVARQADSDAMFAAALKACGNVTLGHVFFDDESQEQGLDQQTLQQYNDILAYQAYPQVRPVAGQRFRFFVAHPEKPEQQFDAKGVEPNLRIFADAAKASGFMNNYAGADAIFRRAPLVMRYPEKVKTQLEENFFPSLPVQVTREYLKAGPDQTIFWFNPTGPERLVMGDRIIVPDVSGQVLVNFAGPAGTFTTYSFADVIDGKVAPGTFKDKIVYVGATAAGVISDIRPTPYQKQGYPGVEIHANVTDNILNNSFLSRGFAEEITDLWVLLLCGAVMGLVFVAMRPSLSWGAFLVAALGLLAFTYLEFSWNRRWLDLVIPGFTLAANYVGVTSYRVIFEEREKRKVRGAFGMYVHPGLISQMMKNPDLLRLGGEEVIMTVMFSDVRGFTSISEKLTPTQLVLLLNEYLTAMSDIIMAHWGTVDKYEGDAIMAFWGRPYPQPDHAARAARACLQMLARLGELNDKWRNDGRQALNIGVGLNTGPMVVGNMGSNKRFNYTVMGDAVNLGSRLEGQNKEYGTRIIISQSTYEEVREEFVCRELDLIRVKGKLKPVAIYELMAPVEERARHQALLAVFAQGLAAYRAARFQEALQIFEEIVAGYPNDGPAKLFAQRCRMYLQAPPPQWDGVFVATSK